MYSWVILLALISSTAVSAVDLVALGALVRRGPLIDSTIPTGCVDLCDVVSARYTPACVAADGTYVFRCVCTPRMSAAVDACVSCIASAGPLGDGSTDPRTIVDDYNSGCTALVDDTHAFVPIALPAGPTTARSTSTLAPTTTTRVTSVATTSIPSIVTVSATTRATATATSDVSLPAISGVAFPDVCSTSCNIVVLTLSDTCVGTTGTAEFTCACNPVIGVAVQQCASCIAANLAQILSGANPQSIIDQYNNGCTSLADATHRYTSITLSVDAAPTIYSNLPTLSYPVTYPASRYQPSAALWTDTHVSTVTASASFTASPNRFNSTVGATSGARKLEEGIQWIAMGLVGFLYFV